MARILAVALWLLTGQGAWAEGREFFTCVEGAIARRDYQAADCFARHPKDVDAGPVKSMLDAFAIKVGDNPRVVGNLRIYRDGAKTALCPCLNPRCCQCAVIYHELTPADFDVCRRQMLSQAASGKAAPNAKPAPAVTFRPPSGSLPPTPRPEPSAPAGVLQ